jgi:hypothetical protein
MADRQTHQRDAAARAAGSSLTRLAFLLGAMAVVLLFAVPALRSVYARIKHAPVEVAWQEKSVSLPVWSRDGFFDSGPALEEAKASGANAVTLVVTWYAPNERSAEIARTSRTASDNSLVWAISRARALGLDVMLKPQVDIEDDRWRAYLNPEDADRWFANYAALINHYAEMAQRNSVEMLCIGTELISMSTNPAYEERWRGLIAGVRDRYAGNLTYSANWGGGYFAEDGFADEFNRLPFWDALDYLGISAYFELTRSDSPTVEDLKKTWRELQKRTIEPFHRRWQKPVLFTEIGYRSVRGAARMPWAAQEPLPLDLREQVDCLEALFESWKGVSWFAGASLWMWSADMDVAPTDTGYSVQNKPAHATLIKWYGGTTRVVIPGQEQEGG